MTPYKNFKFIYPPRPEYMIPCTELYKYETTHLAQPKLNGSCVIVFIKGNEFRYFGRHQNENLKGFKLTINDFKNTNFDDNEWNVVVGEYMNKNQNGIDGKPWNHKFVIFDILVHNGQYLLGTTLAERIKILDELYGVENENEYLYKVNENVFRVKTFTDNFIERWKKITEVGMLEGFVLKKPNAKLERGMAERNNALWQLKSRKSTKNYNF